MMKHLGVPLKKVFILCFILAIIIIGYNIVNERTEINEVFYFVKRGSEPIPFIDQSNVYHNNNFKDHNNSNIYNLDNDDTFQNKDIKGEELIDNFTDFNISSEYLVHFKYVGYFEYSIPKTSAYKCKGLDDNFYYIIPSSDDINQQQQTVDMEIYYDVGTYFENINDNSPNHVPRMLMALEPPPFRGCENDKQCVESFNFKVSYESQSDIRFGFDSSNLFELFRKYPLSLILDIQNQFKKEYEEMKLNNTLQPHQTSFPLVNWFCSNCDTQSNRIKYVEELMKYLVIDSFGGCLKNMPTPEFLARRSNDPFGRKRSFITKYKFTIVFENSLCQDYVSEKVLDALVAGSVPIFMAHPNTLKYLPYQSYIYVGNFNSAMELANHIKYLSENDQEYYKFHAWRTNETAIEQWKGVNNYPNKPGFTLKELQCPMLRHFLRLKSGKIPLKTLRYKPFEEVCLPSTYYKIFN